MGEMASAASMTKGKQDHRIISNISQSIMGGKNAQSVGDLPIIGQGP